MAAQNTAAAAVVQSTAGEEAHKIAEGAVHTATAVAAVHKVVVVASVDILEVSVAEAVDFQAVQGFSLDQVRVGLVLEADSAVLVVEELRAQEEDRSDSHKGLVEVVDELEVRIRSSAVVVEEACHILLVVLGVAFHKQPVVRARRELSLREERVRLLLLGLDLHIARIGHCDDPLVDQRPAAESCP